MEKQLLAPELWVERYGAELYGFALRRVHTADCSEELVQETLLSALSALDSYRGEASERTWLFVILRRKIIDHYRREARSPLVPLGEADEETQYFYSENGHWREEQYPRAWNMPADDVLAQQELSEALQLCQEKLPARHGAVFTMRFVDELSAEEICQELGLTPSNYWVLVHRAKLHLRKCLEKNWFGQHRAA